MDQVAWQHIRRRPASHRAVLFFFEMDGLAPVKFGLS